MNFSLYIARRYLKSKSTNNAINFITLIAIIGVILASAALFIVLSGFAGLKDYSLQFTTIIDPDLKVESVRGKSFIVSPNQISKLKNLDQIEHVSLVIEERVIASFDGKDYMAIIKGVDENYNLVNAVDSIIVQGSWLSQKSNQLVVGWGISNNLSFGVLDYGKHLKLFVPKAGKGQITSLEKAFNSVNAVNVGIFDINENINDSYIYSSLSLTQRLLGYEENQISSIELKLKNNAEEEFVRNEINTILGNNIVIKNRAQLNDSIYKMLNSENLFVYLLLTLISVILIFNVAGSIIMMVLDKKENIITLYNLGATVKEIRRIFYLQGSLIVLIGGALGVLIGVSLVLLQKFFNLVMITPSLPYPVVIEPINFLIVFSTIYTLGILASRIASSRISKTLVNLN